MTGARIRASLGEAPSQLPRGAGRVQLVVPAAEVLLTCAQLPKGARRRPGALAFAIEEASAAEPDANQVSWLGLAGGRDALAVLDRRGLERWRLALAEAGVRAFEVHVETLLLPLAQGEWSLAWDGAEGFVRSGEFAGAATDGGDDASPPLALRMLLEEAKLRDALPRAIAVYVVAPASAPDLKRWEAELGVPLRLAGAWDWRTAPAGSGLAQERRRWSIAPDALARLRPAAWIAGLALALHGGALVVDWIRLGGEQRALRADMEARFRSAFPDAVAVMDPALQMRRQLALARHRAGIGDGGDFAPMIEKLAPALKTLPAGTLRTLSYEDGRMTLELGAAEDAAVRRAADLLVRAGLVVDAAGAKQIRVRAP